MSVGILGNGEIGSALYKVYQLAGYTNNVVVRDPRKGLESSLSGCDTVNVCIPFSGHDRFVEALVDLHLKHGCVVIIQSTVACGTTDRVQARLPHLVCCHSPVRGVHPALAEGLLAFEKYVGVSDAFLRDEQVKSNLVRHVRSLGMQPVLCRAKESELAKIVSTTLYGVNIAAVTDVSRLCEDSGVDFGTVFTRWQTGYNSGYRALGKENVCRPVLTPIPTNPEGERVIGGHCVLPNCVILRENARDTNLADFVLRFADARGDGS
ncbi:unnamed protein product [Pylaiella littoralis]